MKSNVLCFLFMLCHFADLTNGIPTTSRIVKPGYHEIPGTNGLYKYHDTLSVWDDAAATCAAEGASLYYAENYNEFHTVIRYWQTMRNDFPKLFFVGIKKSDGVFKTINGIPITNVFHEWLSGEPNNAGNENCVEAWNYKDVWGLNDKDCNIRRTFICKLPNIDEQCSSCMDGTTEGNIGTLPGYYNIPGTNGLYKYHDTLSVWEDAAATCAAEGASLYYAENDNEFHTVIRYWQTMRNDFPKLFFVGIKKSDGVFKTINGIPITNVFHEWLSGEPNNAGNENCVEAWNYKDVWGLNDKDCNIRRTFICKLPNIDEQCSSCMDGTTEGNIGTLPGYYNIPGTNGLYKYHDTLSVWEDAAATCAAEGASLYYAENDNEFHTVIRYWQTMRNDFPKLFFVGIKKSDGVFKTINGIPITNVFHEWLSGEPNNAGNENCVEAWNYKDVWGLNDKDCNIRRTFICKLPNIDEQCSSCMDGTTEGNIGRSVLPGYYNIPGTNGLYKYHDSLSVWEDAAATCAAEGASLYYAENDNEFHTVIRYWQTMRNDFPKLFFVGIKKSDGVFKTINGIPITNVFHEWLSGEPNNAGNENCVEAWNYKDVWGLNDKDCNIRRTFICKLPNIDEQCSSCMDGTTEGNIGRSVLPGYYNIPGTNGLYKYHDSLSVWEDAAATCAAEGASLYYAENDNEFHTVIRYWQTMRNDFPKLFFVGIKKSDGVFKTINGIPITNVFHGWLSGEPNNAGNENCVEAWNYKDVWGLNDKDCNTRRTFICKLPNIDGQSSDTSFTDGAAEGSIGTSPGYTNIPGTNGLYKYHDTLSVWDGAAATCAAEGASLYYAENDNEFHTVIRYWQTMRNDFPKLFFVGIKKSDGVFKTINGIPIVNVYHGWLSGEPNNAGNENCVEAWNYKDVWGLNDKSCDVRRTFICKIPHFDVQCDGTSSIGYTFIEPLGRCYKLHQNPKNWSEARNVCQAEGSDLAVINSFEEAAHLVRLTSKINHVPGNFTRGVIYLGFYKRYYETWYTIQDEPISNSGYPCWGNDQPDGGDDAECGAMYYNGRLNDIECDRKALFICEHVIDDPNIITEPKKFSLSESDCNIVHKSIFSYYPFLK